MPLMEDLEEVLSDDEEEEDADDFEWEAGLEELDQFLHDFEDNLQRFLFLYLHSLKIYEFYVANAVEIGVVT